MGRQATKFKPKDAAFFNYLVHNIRLYLTLGGTHSVGQAINNAGWVAGVSNLQGDRAKRVFLYDGVTMRDLGSFGGTILDVFGMNDLGCVVGMSSKTGTILPSAFLYDGTTMRDLGYLPGHVKSAAHDINNFGQVVGLSAAPAGYLVPFIWTESHGMVDLNTLLAPNSPRLWSAYGINDRGQIVGSGVFGDSAAGPILHAVLLTPVPEPHTVVVGMAALLVIGVFRRNRPRM